MGDARESLEPAVDDGTHRALERVFREESGVVLASLIATTGDFDLAEDAFQDAVTAAIERWPEGGVPANPGAWLTTAARRKAIDRLRRASVREQKRDALRVLEATRRSGPPAVVMEAGRGDAECLFWFRGGAVECLQDGETPDHLGHVIARELLLPRREPSALDPEDRDVGRGRLRRDGDPGDQPPAADRNDERIQAGLGFEHLQTDGSLTADHVEIVIGMHEGETVALRDLSGRDGRRVERVAGQDDLGA